MAHPRRLGAGGLPALPATGVQRAPGAAIDDALLEPAGVADAAARADPRDRRGAGQLRLPSHPRAAATRGLAGESQADVPALPRRGAWIAAQTTEAATERRRPPAARRRDAAERALEHGLHERRAGKRTEAARADGGRCLHARVRRARGRRALPRRGRRGDPDARRRTRGLPDRRSTSTTGRSSRRGPSTTGRRRNRVQLDFSRPGKPTDNATIESFNASVRRECLSQHYFSTLAEAQVVLGSTATTSTTTDRTAA